MAAAYDFVVDTGIILPDTATLQTEVTNEYLEAFGTDLVTAPETPQGVQIVAETLARDSVARNNATVANQLNPNVAGGVALDAIGALTGLEREAAIPSILSGVVITGVPGTLVTTDLIIGPDDIDGPFFQLKFETVIGPGGNAFGEFECTTEGPLAASANTVTRIFNEVIGVETVNNPTAAAIGQLVQSDISFRATRNESLALQGSGLAEAIVSQLTVTGGVTSKSFRENVTNEVLVIDGITMLPHSMYACVAGGLDVEVATSIRGKKDGGCNYSPGVDNGTPVTVPLLEPFSGQIIPVTFTRPDPILILVRATVKVTGAVGNPAAQVKKAILDYADGNIDGETGLGIGVPVSCFELAGAVNREIPSLYVQNMETTLEDPVDYSNDEIPIALWQRANITEDSIVVVVV